MHVLKGGSCCNTPYMPRCIAASVWVKMSMRLLSEVLISVTLMGVLHHHSTSNSKVIKKQQPLHFAMTVVNVLGCLTCSKLLAGCIRGDAQLQL